jgi:hypothetical protein
MSTIIVRHTVKDYDAWRPVYDEHASTRNHYGISDISLHRDHERPNDIVIVFRTDDLARASEFFASEDLRQTMERAGVVSEPGVWILDDV